MRFPCMAALLLGAALFSPSLAQKAEQTSAPKNIEIHLNTDGDLILSGVPGASKVSINKSKNPVNDELVKEFSEEKETKVFTTKAEAKKNKKHQNLAIDIPDGSLVSLRTQEGDVTISGVNAYLSGHVRSGAVVLTGLMGEIELVSEQGDILATGIEAGGMLIARKGSIRLTDVTGLIATHAPQGRVSLSIGTDYYRKSPRPLDVGLEEGDIEITSAPFGGKVWLGKGTLVVSDITQRLAVEGGAANVTLRGLAAPLSLRNQGNVNVQLVKFADKKQEDQKVNIETSHGDVTLELAKNFSGILEMWITETNPTDQKAPISSTIPLENAIIADNGFGNGVVNVRETTKSVVIGKGGPKVTVHVTNGKVIINN